MKIKLKSIPPPPPKPVYKASLHKTGKIGLAIDTAKEFGLTTDKSIELFINEADPEDKNVYGVLHNAGQQNTYKIMKAGDYHSINAKDFFDAINVNTEKETTGYVVSIINVDGTDVIKFERVKKDNGSAATTAQNN